MVLVVARSTKIYVVFQGKQLLGAFTVKHEMITHAGRYWSGMSNLHVVEVPDGRVGEFKVYPLVEISTTEFTVVKK